MRIVNVTLETCFAVKTMLDPNIDYTGDFLSFDMVVKNAVCCKVMRTEPGRDQEFPRRMGFLKTKWTERERQCRDIAKNLVDVMARGDVEGVYGEFPGVRRRQGNRVQNLVDLAHSLRDHLNNLKAEFERLRIDYQKRHEH